MSLLRSALSAFTVALFVACSSGGTGGGVISLGNYATSCQADSECVPIVVGTLSCCDCPNAAINKSDLGRYQADALAATASQGVCNVLCGACNTTTVTCSHGTCALVQPSDGGPSDGGTGDAGPTACGSSTCTSAEVCVMDQLEGGAIMLPDDAGACPTGDQNKNGICQPLPTYHCAPTPSACAAGLSCGCAQPLCDSGYTCQTASAGLVQCFLMAP